MLYMMIILALILTIDVALISRFLCFHHCSSLNRSRRRLAGSKFLAFLNCDHNTHIYRREKQQQLAFPSLPFLKLCM